MPCHWSSSKLAGVESVINEWVVAILSSLVCFRFLQVAEESSRNAFQSIESLVHAFSSVSMMLESTYHAMYSSFRAVLGVVDNFSRLRQMFSQFISAITILNIIRNFYKRLLHWLGIDNSVCNIILIKKSIYQISSVFHQ